MRHLYTLTAILVLIAEPGVVVGQQIRPAGVVTTRHVERSEPTPIRANLPHAVLIDSAQGHPWRWVGTGALLGAATGGVVAAVSVSRTDDAILAGPAIGATAVAGAVVGGLIGGLFYLITH